MINIKKILFLSVVLLTGFFIGYFSNKLIVSEKTVDVINPPEKVLKPLEKYTIENLSKTDISPGKIKITNIINEEEIFTSYLFEFEFNPNLDGKTFKKTTGQINLPKTKGNYPVILMLRGYIDQKLYITGDGTRNAARFFSRNGYVTISPDYLGYGSSDEEAENIFESRFQTYVTALSLIKYIENNSELNLEIGNTIENWKLEIGNLYLWGHSNGGQIALTVLEITGKQYPTTLWAPVSKPFPYSVLFYTDESVDGGKLIRSELAKLEEDYDVELFSLTNYLNKINSPIQIQQGTSDGEVPVEWSDDLVNKLNNLGKDVIYNKFPGTDHNMRPSWNQVVEKDLEFFNKNLSQNR